MRKFNDEDFKSLEHLEEKFETAIKSRYVTGLTKPDFDKLIVIYRETLGRQANISCSACVLQMMTQIGRLFKGYKANLTENDKGKQEHSGDSDGGNSKDRSGTKEKVLKGSKGNK